MTAITSTQSGNWTSTSTWTGGVVPTITDTVTSTHDITLDGVCSCASYTGNSGAIIRASTSTNSEFRCNGKMNFSSGSSRKLLIDLSAYPAVSCIFTFNYSNGSDADSGISMQDGNDIVLKGANRKRTTQAQGAISVSSTGTVNITVDDATGWLAGDVLILSTTQSYSATTKADRVVISSISGNVVTIDRSATSIAYAHADRCYIGNLSSNVMVMSPSASTRRAYVECNHSYTAGTVPRLIQDVSFMAQTGQYYQYSLFINNNYADTRPWDGGGVNNNAFETSGDYCVTLNNLYTPVPRADNLFYLNHGTPVRITGTPIIDVGDEYRTVVLRSGGPTEVPAGRKLYNSIICGSQHAMTYGGAEVVNGKFWSNSFGATTANGALGKFTSCAFDLEFSGATSQSRWSIPESSLLTISSPTAPGHADPGVNGLNVYHPSGKVFINSLNGDITDQRIYTRQSTTIPSIIRDNSTRVSGNASIKIMCNQQYGSVYQETTFQAVSGVTYTILGKVQYTGTNANQPTITVTGGNATTTFTSPAVKDVWNDVSISFTQTSGSTVTTTINFSLSATSTSTCYAYFDGITCAPFVDFTRHYGKYFNQNPYVTSNPVIQQTTEATVAAYTGIAINHSTSTITITSNHTIREIYDYIYYNLSQTANLTKAEWFLSDDALNYSSSYNMVLNNCAITGIGNLSMPTSSLTLIGTTSSTVLITYSTGVYTSINVSGLVNGSRLQIYNVTTSTEVYNGVPGTSYSVNKNWTSDETIRIRAAYTSGATAKLGYETVGIFGNTGLSIFVSQVDDTVYNANAIDGSTVTEYAADYLTVRIDISDSDGIAPVQRGYAWYVYNLTTSGGIANYFGSMVAEDRVNYRLNQNIIAIKIRNIGTIATVFSGARLYCSDGSSTFDMQLGDYPLSNDPDRVYIENISTISTAIAAIPTNPLLTTDTRITNITNNTGLIPALL